MDVEETLWTYLYAVFGFHLKSHKREISHLLTGLKTPRKRIYVGSTTGIVTALSVSKTKDLPEAPNFNVVRIQDK